MASLDDRGTGEAPRTSRPDYVPKVALVPQTVADLMQRAGPYADAVKANLEWSAVTVWLMKEGYGVLAASDLPSAVACLSVILTREAEEHAAGWPRLSGPAVTPAIYGYSPDSQCEARRSAAQARSMWEANGRPYLRASDCKLAFQHLAACIRTNIIPPVPTIGDVPLNS
jgi:hypothetical protein